MEENKNSSMEENGEKIYTQADVDKMIEEGRKKATEEAEREAERRYSKKQKESERLSKMNEEDFKFLSKLLEKSKEQELALAENKAVATSILVEKGLSPNLVNFVVAVDADDMNNNIKLLEKEFKACVKAEVEKRIGKHSPRNSDKDDTMDKDAFNKLPLHKQQELYKSNPDLYKQLIGG